ncbi:methionine ABC transporter ATP-binding protein [Sansalvadorimonas sp. 2012CJ34-2]|uniref:Methionine ABC transporter ATP-binding protein n=1 Tax=Parendozoicomonas callyspongiae TaxID=2942213 RepID=A0ABT0PHG2_9GAMM|nr:methionine ABC transporter ATP-binding protein [Sansalvadorimonas sp. 2012CJ34-2]MCL6270696.1 methionine ABC transporter ATP-binding protein [Sansalvadorimonas sp. 2012CJ34-2]
MIRFEKVSKVFRGSSGTVKALDDVSLWIPEGSIYGVIGSSGAGKSTLIRCANLLERPTAGRVVVDGRDLVQLSPADLRNARRDIGMIFQYFNLLANSTVYENIALPLKLAGEKAARIEETIAPLLELVGLEDKRDSYPSQLSGGQKQRVAIARALASQPKVLLCDEATSALDPKTTVSILNLLRDINRKLGLTILLITHEMEVVKSICDQVAILSDGQVVEHNDVESFFLNPQTDLAREFVRAAVHEKPIEDLPAGIQKEQTEGSHPVLHITFLGNSTVQPLITQAARQFNLDFSIIQADMETVHGKTMGFLTVEVVGDELNAKSAQAFLRKHDLQVEVAGYVC